MQVYLFGLNPVSLHFGSRHYPYYAVRYPAILAFSCNFLFEASFKSLRYVTFSILVLASYLYSRNPITLF